MNDQAITSLIKVLLNGSDASYRLKRKIHHALDPDYVSILWHVSEVEHIAAMDEEGKGEPIGSIYDRSRFRELLEDVCEGSEYGVTVETIEQALDWCKLGGE